MKIEIDVEIPDGYQFLRYDFVNRGERFINGEGNNRVWASKRPSSAKFAIIEAIIEAIKRYRDPSIPGELCEAMQAGTWRHRFFVGKTRSGAMVVENDGGELSWGYLGCRVEVLKANEPEETKWVVIPDGYRAVTVEDLNTEVLVCNNPGEWYRRKLSSLKTSTGTYQTSGCKWWKYARVEVKPAYRKTTEDDVGKQVEVSDYEDFSGSHTGTLYKIRPRPYRYRFVLDGEAREFIGWRFSRIRND